ncbi:MAG: hypothetical protein Kow0096_22120 [Thiohalomonadaceae bacterium]
MTPLGMWHGDPLAAAAAQALLARARQRQRRGQRQRRCRTCALQELVARYWLGEDMAALYHHALPLLRRSAHGRALLELITGQLLLSRRLNGARQHLERGFHLASRLFTPADYLAVLKRQQQLACLPLGDTPLPAATLTQLLTTAQVIERMEGGRRPPQGKHDPTDLYG